MELHAVAQWLIICDTLENALSQIPLCDTFPAQVFRSECFSLLFSFASTFRHPSIEPFCHCTMYHYMNNVHWEGSLFPKEKKRKKEDIVKDTFMNLVELFRIQRVCILLISLWILLYRFMLILFVCWCHLIASVLCVLWNFSKIGPAFLSHNPHPWMYLFCCLSSIRLK